MGNKSWLNGNIKEILAIVWVVTNLVMFFTPAIEVSALNLAINITMLIIGYYFGSAEKDDKKDK